MAKNGAPCRKCGRPTYVRRDETVSPHNAQGQPCPGSHRPPEGEPPCTVYCGAVGRVSWPEDLYASGAHASTYVCANPEHQAEAALWVEAKTGHRGVFVPFRKRVTVDG